ncbi:MAG: phage holin family protein [Chloroflexota bacterium]
MDERRDERSLGQLFGDVSRQLSTLIRQEIELARTEMTTKATTVGRDAALIGVGGALVYAGVLALMAALILALADAGWQPWVAALLVGIVVLAIGAVLGVRGRDGLTKAEVAPRRTIETLRDDAEWAKERVK